MGQGKSFFKTQADYFLHIIFADVSNNYIYFGSGSCGINIFPQCMPGKLPVAIIKRISLVFIIMLNSVTKACPKILRLRPALKPCHYFKIYQAWC